MYEFEDFVYLDVQKTGSTFVRNFLKKFARSGSLRAMKHEPVEGRAPGKIYIISCRDPLAQYVSLYSYGCMGEGTFYRRMVQKDQGHLYKGTTEGLIEWLDVVLDPSVRLCLAGNDDNAVLNWIGVQSMRFLRLALPDYLSQFAAINSQADANKRLRKEGLCDVVLRTETLSTDLAALVSGKHQALFKDHAAALQYLEAQPKKNTSEGVFDIDPSALPRKTLRHIERRERLFFKVLGYPRYTASEGLS